MKLTRRVAICIVVLAMLACSAVAETEAQLRARLGIPPDAKRVLILSQSSHMDWDWNRTFPDYYDVSVDNILEVATHVLAKYSTNLQPYYYSVAETGFLQRFWQKHPNALQSLRNSGHTLHMVGGGITSPDSLLNHGEVFIRNFLVGQRALRNVSLPAMTNIWVPDDFGHDGQLPVMVRAMGLGAAGFARVPGAMDQGPSANRLDGQPSVAQQLMKEGVSFIWQAQDGSEMFAHWLQDHYNQGDDIDRGTTGSPNDCSSYSSSFNTMIINSNIQGYINSNGPTSVSPYMFVAIGDDFKAPKPCLLTYAQNWNKGVFNASSNPVGYSTDVYVVSATFDHYVALVKAYTSNPANQRPLAVRRFEPTPYWTGFYASRPLLKINQEAAIRRVMAAESLSYLTKTAFSLQPTLREAWDHLAPSTHHDFVTGTSPDQVYQTEQIPYLLASLEESGNALSLAMKALGSRLQANARGSGNQAVVMYNPLGAPRYGTPVKLPIAWLPNATSFWDGKVYQPIHKHDDFYHTQASFIPSVGYQIGSLSNHQPSSIPSHLALIIADNDTYILRNRFIQATISKAANWAVTSIVDLTNGRELLQPSEADLGAFSLQILRDDGNIYRFANEMPNCHMGTTSPSQTPLDIIWDQIHNHHIFITFPTQVQVNVNGQIFTFSRNYTLYSAEHMLRVSVTGQAPSGTSVFMRTPLTFLQPFISYGTPYHYDTHMPAAYWSGYNFLAAHNFFTLTSLEGINVAFYSSTIRAWAMDGTVVVAALFRNTPGGVCNGYGADGTDSDVHTHQMAFRTPNNLQAAPSIIPLQESLDFSTPILTGTVSSQSSITSPPLSLVSVSSNAIITSVKPAESNPNQLVVRIYSPAASLQNPTTVSLNTSLSLGFNRGAVVPITALENPLPSQENSIQILQIAMNSATLRMRAALVTVLIQPH